jgi:hypothetical protein
MQTSIRECENLLIAALQIANPLATFGVLTVALLKTQAFRYMSLLCFIHNLTG